jgi:hypothetical protein
MCGGGSVRGSGLMCGSGLVIRVNSSPVHFILLLHFFKIDTPHLTQEICPHLTNTNEENQRVNRDFGEAPLEPTSLFEREPRQITSDGYLHDGGNRYPVSMELPPGGLGRICFWMPSHPEHEILNEAYREKRKQKQGAVTKKFKMVFGSVGETYLEGLRQKVSGNLQQQPASLLIDWFIMPIFLSFMGPVIG